MNVVYILKTYYFCCYSVTKSCPTLCNLMPGFPVLQCLLVFSNSSLLSQRCHSTISSSDVPFSSCPQSFPASVSFPVNWLFGSGGQSIRASASAPVLSMNIQGWYPLGWLIWSPCCPRDSQASSPMPQFEGISSSVLSLLYHPALTLISNYWKTIDLTLWNFVNKVMSLLLRFVITFLSESKRLLISWLLSPSAVILRPRKWNLSLFLLFPPSICHEVMGLDAMIFFFLNVEF